MRLPEKPPEKRINMFDKSLEDDSLINRAMELNKRYPYWSELKYKTKSLAEQKVLWTLIKLLRSNSIQIPYKSIALHYSLLPIFAEKLHQFDKSLAGNIETQSKTLGLRKSYISSSLMEEAIASSIIEGASTTRKVAKQMLQQKRKPKTRSEIMITNNYETMQFILDKKQEPLTPDILLEIQKTITKNTLDNPEDEGKFRDTDDVRITQNSDPSVIHHIPPKNKEIKKLVEQLCDFANSDEFIHPIIKGITLHFLIGYIHPFNDGNGRTARSVFYWYMLQKGYWLFEYMSVSRIILKSRRKYDLAYLYTEYDNLDLTYFIKYNIDCIDKALEDLTEYIKRKQEEASDTKKILQKYPDLNLRQASILEEFINNPNKIFTIKEISETYRVVYQTARTDLLTLTEKQFISKKTSGREFVFSLKD